MKWLSGKALLLGLLVVAVLAGAGIWWFAIREDDNSSSSTVGTSATAAKVESKCLEQVDDKNFCKFAKAFSDVGAYKVAADITNAEGKSTLELAADTKGNSQMNIVVNGQRTSMVLYNDATYLKDSTDGQWMKMSSNSTGDLGFNDIKKEFAKGDFKTDDGRKIDYLNRGKEKCGNLTCYKYEIKDPSKPNEKGFLWFDTEDYLPRRISIDDGSSKTNMTITYTSVTVSEPSPVKESPVNGFTE